MSRQALINTKFTCVIGAPVYSQHDGLSTQVAVGVEEGLKRDSSIHRDELVSLPKMMLTRYVGRLGDVKMAELNEALVRALELDEVGE